MDQQQESPAVVVWTRDSHHGSKHPDLPRWYLCVSSKEGHIAGYLSAAEFYRQCVRLLGEDQMELPL